MNPPIQGGAALGKGFIIRQAGRRSRDVLVADGRGVTCARRQSRSVWDVRGQGNNIRERIEIASCRLSGVGTDVGCVRLPIDA